ncbi:MAG: hypothetical protein ISS70_26975 [Phycisphaerae bacterium]|nr:hypothetical protein [Phycisphaerae bacterium]
MRRFFIIAAITLMALGCNKKDDEGTSKLPESEVANGQEAGATQELKRTPEANTDDSTKKSKVDPVFKDYEYPASTLEDTFSMGNTVSVIYKSPDDFAEVVEFYKQKFPDAPPQSGTTVYFGKENADGSAFTVTLTQLSNDTQIILRLDKKI